MEMTTGRRVEATVRLNEVSTSFITWISISPYWPMIVFLSPTDWHYLRFTRTEAFPIPVKIIR